MANWTYRCKKCKKDIDIVGLISEYTETVLCPKCGRAAPRDLAGDFKKIKLTIDIPKTLGSLADKQADSYSADQKAEMTMEHTKYLRERNKEQEWAPISPNMGIGLPGEKKRRKRARKTNK